jgi:hypothetical protein
MMREMLSAAELRIIATDIRSTRSKSVPPECNDS